MNLSHTIYASIQYICLIAHMSLPLYVYAILSAFCSLCVNRLLQVVEGYQSCIHTLCVSEHMHVSVVCMHPHYSFVEVECVCLPNSYMHVICSVILIDWLHLFLICL